MVGHTTRLRARVICVTIGLGLAACGKSDGPPSSDAPAKADTPRAKAPADLVAVGPFEVEGSKMYADPRDQVITPWLKKGVWEPLETALFRSEIGEGDVVVDVGANVGYYTLIAAQKVGKTGQVWAFEPDPDSFELLRRNVELNGYDNVQLVPKALGAKPGTLRLYRHPTNRGDHRIYDPGDTREAVQVAVTTLDQYFATRDRVDLIKIDTQGAECTILAGAGQTLQRHDDVRLIMEYTPQYIRQMGADPAACLSGLDELGFAFYEILEFAQNKAVVKTDLDTLRARYPESKDDYTNLFLPSRRQLAAGGTGGSGSDGGSGSGATSGLGSGSGG